MRLAPALIEYDYSDRLLLVVANEQTPYRIHFHRRIVREIDGVDLRSVFTHQQATSPWQWQDLDEIHALQFGVGEASRDQSKPGRALHEWRKAGRILSRFAGQNVKAMVVYGYNDLCRLRLIFWCRRNNVPCFLFGDSNILADTGSTLKRAAKQLLLPPILRACSGVLVCGDLGQRYFERYGVPPAAIHKVPYEPDYTVFAQPSRDRIAAIRNSFSLSQTRRRIIFVGRMEPVKDPQLLLDAFIEISPQLPDWDLLMVGEGSLRQRLQSLVPPALASRIIWTGFFEDPNDLAALYSLSDVFVLPSRVEPWGVVVSEAACHLALIASDQVGAAHELIRDGVNGFRFRAGDLQDLKSKLLELMKNPELDRFKQASQTVLDDWRREADPVKGLITALRSAGVQAAPAAFHTLDESHPAKPDPTKP